MSDPIIDAMLADQRQQDQPQVQDASSDPIIQQMRQDQQTQTSRAALAVAGASNVNPDRAAQNQQLAARYKVPPNVVDQFPEAFRQRALTENAASALQQAPVVRDAIAQNPQLAQVAHDSVPMLSKIESTIMELPKALGGAFNEAAKGVNLVAGALPTVYDKLTGGSAASDWWFRNMVAPLEAQRGAFDVSPDTGFAGKALHTVGSTLGLISQATLAGPVAAEEQGAQLVPTVAQAVRGMFEHGVKSMAMPSLAAGVNTASDVYNATGSGAAALKAGEASYATNTLGGIIPFGAPGRLLTRLGAGAASGLLSADVSRQLMNASLPEGMQQAEPSGEDRILDALSGAVFGGLAGPHDAADLMRRSYAAARDTYVQSARAEEAASAAQTIAKLSELSAQTPLRERDPDSFKQLVASVADEAQVDHLYVSGRTFAEALDKSGVSADELIDKVPGLAGQMREALQTEGMVRIPLEDYATHIAGTPLDQALQPELRIAPDAMTFGEAVKFHQDQAAEFEKQAQNIVGEKAQADEFKASGQKVEDYVRDQLAATGRFPDAVNDAYAKIHRAFFDTTAARAGMLPHELLEQHGLEVRADALPEGGAPTMDQGGVETPEFKRWFGKSLVREPLTNSKERLEDKKPLVVYHATKGDFHTFETGRTTGNNYGLLGDVETQRHALFFAEDPSFAEGYGKGEGQNVMPVYLKIENPLYLDEGISGHDLAEILKHTDKITRRDFYDVPADQMWQAFDDEFGKNFVDAAKAAGFDGAFMIESDPKTGESRNVWAAFDPEQIKSATGNRGTFDPSDPNILHQQARGQITLPENGPAIVSLFKSADLSTFLHESGHYFLEVMSDLAHRMGPDSDIGRDFQKALEWTGGAKDAESWRAMSADEKREAHEKFARGFETYLMEGRAPTMELQSLFGRFRAWLVNIYKNVAGLRAELTPDMRGVFDRMVASQDAIEQAERTRGMLGLFKTPEDMGLPRSPYHDVIEKAQPISAEDARRLVTGKTEKPGGVDPATWIKDGEQWYLADVPTDRIRSNEAGDRYDATVDAGRAKDYAGRPGADAPPVILRGGKRSEGRLNVLDGGHRVSAARARGDETVKALIRISQDDALEAWQKYQADQRLATEDAIADLQSKSIRDMKWISNLKDRAVRRLVGEAKAARTTIREQVEREVNALPAFQAKEFMRANKGVDRELVAERFGYTSAEQMAQDISDHGSKADAIEGLTDQRMLEEHGELTDPVAIERAAEAAIHNDVRARVLARELNALAKATGSARMLAKAAKEAAEAAIARKTVGEINPKQYTAAETRAAKAADAAMKKGDTQEAVIQKRAQLLNNRLAKAALDAQTEVQKGLDYLKRFTKDSVRDKIDVDIRDQIDALLEKVDLRKNPPDEPPREVRNLRDWRDSQVAAGLMPSIDERLLDPALRQHYQDMSLEQFRGLVDAVKSMEHVGKERNTLTLDGERLVLDDVVRNNLLPKLEQVGERFSFEERYTKPEDRDLGALQLTLARLSSWMRSTHAMLLRPDYKANVLDRHELNGPFQRFVFQPLLDASYKKAEMLKALSDRFAAKAEELGKDWQKSLTDNVTNTTLMEPIASQEAGQPVPMKINRGRMLMIALHSGNESNFDKLTKGYGWKPEDVWRFLAENMTAKDIAAVNAVHALYESHWPEVEAMYRRLGQTVPPKIEARPVDLPAGRLDGGYAHIDYDPLKSRRGQKAGQNEAKEIADNGVSVKDYFRRQGTTNGAMNARVQGYTDMIDLDFHGIEAALRETIHDLAYREALVNVNKVLEHPELKDGYLKAYGRESLDALHTWMGRIANSQNADRDVRALTKVLAYARTGMVMNAIALRASTVVKHGGAAAFKTMGYFAGGGEAFYAARQAAMVHDYKNQMAEAIERSPEIRQRLLQQDRDYRSTAHHLFEAEGWQPKAERFGHAFVAFADAFSAVATHNAAYDWAITKGIPERLGGTGEPMSHADAVRFADKTVREAHGSTSEAAMSNIMANKSEGVKLFTTLYGFMNNSYGQMADYASKLRTAGIGKPEILARSFAAIIVPALAAGWVAESPEHDWHAKEWAEWVAKSIAEECAATVPLLRDAAAMLKGLPSAGQVPVESWLHALVAPIQDAMKLYRGEHAPVVQDVANALGEGLHLPGLGQIGKTAQYEVDVAAGRKEQSVKKAIVGGK